MTGDRDLVNVFLVLEITLCTPVVEDSPEDVLSLSGLFGRMNDVGLGFDASASLFECLEWEKDLPRAPLSAPVSVSESESSDDSGDSELYSVLDCFTSLQHHSQRAHLEDPAW